MLEHKEGELFILKDRIAFLWFYLILGSESHHVLCPCFDSLVFFFFFFLSCSSSSSRRYTTSDPLLGLIKDRTMPTIELKAKLSECNGAMNYIVLAKINFLPLR